MMQENYDVLIVGAGPGGAMCALSLANSGLRVAVVDKAEFPRDKICGDALSGKAVVLLKRHAPDLFNQLHTSDKTLDSWGITFVAPNKKKLDIPFKLDYDTKSGKAPGYISMRKDFDNLLVEEMKKLSNVDFITSFEIETLDITEHEVTVVSKDQRKIKAAVVVGADGAHSVVAKKVNKFKVEQDHYSAGLRAYYKNINNFHQDNFIELHFFKEFLPGYFWIFPLPNGMANVGVGMLSSTVSKKKINLKAELKRIIHEEPTIAPRFKNAEMVDDIKGFGLPLGSKKRSISGQRFMLVGDAASLIDPFTGEGIAHAMISGEKAGQQIRKCFENNDFSAKFILEYEKMVYARLWNELKLSHILQKLTTYPSLFNFVVDRANNSPTLKSTLVSMFDNIDLRKQLKSPLFYAKLLIGK